MRYTIVLLVILFPLLADAQATPDKETVYRDSLLRDAWNNLRETWNLGIDNASGTVDLRAYNKFKSLFDSSATIDDEFNAHFRYAFGTKAKSKVNYQVKGYYEIDTAPKPYDVYAHDVALELRKLTINFVSIIDAGKFYDDSNKVIITVMRTSTAEKTRQFVVDTAKYASAVFESRKIDFKTNKADSMRNLLTAKIVKTADSAVYRFTSADTLRIIMFYDESVVDGDIVRTYKIHRIERMNNSIVCNNDFDGDGILDSEEINGEASKVPGDFSAQGLPDYDLDHVADESDDCPDIFGDAINHGCPAVAYFPKNFQWDAFAGVSLNKANINLPELNQLGYVDESGNDAIDVLQSKKGVLKNPGNTTGINAGANFSYFFGKTRRRSGISIGLSYSGFKAYYELTSPIVYTFKSFDGTDYYRRQITIDSLNEAITYSVFNLPIMFTYRMHFDDQNRSLLNIKFGPSLMLFSTKSDYNAHISFGGLYQTDGENVVYTDLFENGSTYNFFITADSINAQNPNPGANEVFNKLKQNSASYDFADNKPYTGKQKNSLRATVAFNLDINLQKQIGKNWGLQFGAHFMYAALPEKKEKYKPIDKTTDQFNSIYNSTAKTNYSAYGLNLGFVYNF